MKTGATVQVMLADAMARKAEDAGGKYTYRDLENASGVNASYVWRLINENRKPSREILASLSTALHPYFPLDDALIAAGYLPDSTDAGALARFLRGEAVPGFEPEEETPILEDLPTVHAGKGGGVADNQMAYWPVRTRRSGNRLRLEVRGDCMWPEIQPHYAIVIDMDAAPEDGDVVVIETEDGWSLRRFHEGADGPRFTCDNKRSAEQDVRVLPESPMYPVVDVSKGRPRRLPR